MTVNEIVKNLVDTLSKGNQKAFADAIGVRPPTISEIIGGRLNKPSYEVLQKIATAFPNINGSWLLTGTGEMFIKPPESKLDVVPKGGITKGLNMPVVTVDTLGKENIVLVNTKAQGGYPTLFQEPEFYRDLPTLSIPMPAFRNATFRAWEVVGPSMQPSLHPGAVVITKYVDEWQKGGPLQNGYIHVIVTKDTVLIKRLIDRRERGQFGLMSDNEEWSTYNIQAEEVQEIWRVDGGLVSHFPNPRFEERFKISKLVTDVIDLEEKFKRMERELKAQKLLK